MFNDDFWGFATLAGSAVGAYFYGKTNGVKLATDHIQKEQQLLKQQAQIDELTRQINKLKTQGDTK